MGVYTSGAATFSTMGCGAQGGKHPTADEDTKLSKLMTGLSWWDGKHRFGFESVQSLRRWFFNDIWIGELDQTCIVGVYDVPSEAVFCGTTQSVFEGKYHNPEHRVADIPFVSLIDNPQVFDSIKPL
jgi:hypothetical protein